MTVRFGHETLKHYLRDLANSQEFPEDYTAINVTINYIEALENWVNDHDLDHYRTICSPALSQIQRWINE